MRNSNHTKIAMVALCFLAFAFSALGIEFWGKGDIFSGGKDRESVFAYEYEYTAPETGDGTESNPYLITTESEFYYITQNLSAHYRLEADLVFDVRFMPNPYYVPELRYQTGMNDDVYNYVFSFPQTKEFLSKLEQMLAFLLPLYQEEGKAVLVVAVGCTGGRHRSVSIARAVTEYLNKLGYAAYENHRDITRG